MKVLVTGAAGFIGRSVVETLLEEGHSVSALVLPHTDAASLLSLKAEVKVGDVTDRGSIVRAARGADAVIHTAAFVSLYSRRMDEMRRVNITGVEHVASAALEAGVKRMVHLSSIVAVGASSDGTPVTEDFPWPFQEAGIPYVITKREAEKLALRFVDRGLEVVILNPGLVVGAPDPRGSDPGGIQKFLRGQLYFLPEGGASFVDVGDVARMAVAALTRGRSGQRYLIGGENLTLEAYYELLEGLSGVARPRLRLSQSMLRGLGGGLSALTALTGFQGPLSPQVLWMARFRWFADCTKARNELGLSPISIRESLARAVAWYRTQR